MDYTQIFIQMVITGGSIVLSMFGLFKYIMNSLEKKNGHNEKTAQAFIDSTKVMTDNFRISMEKTNDKLIDTINRNTQHYERAVSSQGRLEKAIKDFTNHIT